MLNGVEGTVKLHCSPDWVIEKLWLNGVLDVGDVPVATTLAVRCGELAFSLMFDAAVSPAVQFPEFELPDNVSHAGLSSCASMAMAAIRSALSASDEKNCAAMIV